MSNATTGSDRVAPGQQPPEAEQGSKRGSRLIRLTRPAVTHWQFAVVVAAAIVVRLIVILVYPPILWFNDSYNYIYDAVTHVPDRIRPNGYPFFLDLLTAPAQRLPAGRAAGGHGRGHGRRHLRAAAASRPAVVGGDPAHAARPVRLVRTAPRAHGHGGHAVHLPGYRRRGDLVLERPSLGPGHGRGRPAHRLRHPGAVRRPAAARGGPGGHAGPAGGLAAAGHPGRGRASCPSRRTCSGSTARTATTR